MKNTTALFCLAAISLFSINGYAMGNATKENLESANESFSNGDFYESERILLKVIKSDPDNIEILEKLGTIALWKNDTEKAESYFKEAINGKSWFGKIWPFNVQLKYRLASVYLRADRFKEAAILFGEAAGPFAFGSFKELSIRGKQLALFEKETPYIIEGEDQTDIDFVILDPLPVVKVSVNGSEPVDFFIDTGGEEIILDGNFAKEIGAIIAGEVPQEYAGAKKGLTGYGKINSLSIGGILVRNIPVSTIDLQPTSLSVFNGMEIKGTIGTRFLMHFLSTIDYKNKKLVLRRLTKGTNERFASQISLSKSKEIPFYLVETHLIFARGSFNNQEHKLFFVDTGLAGAGFLSSRAILKKAGVTMDWSKADMGAGGGGMVKGLNIEIDEVSLGSGDNKIVKHNVKGVVFENDISIFNGQLGFKVGGLVSHQVFRDYALTLDFNQMKLILH